MIKNLQKKTFAFIAVIAIVVTGAVAGMTTGLIILPKAQRVLPDVALAGSSVSSGNTFASGIQYSLAINEFGQLYSWGLNSSGQLGLGNTTNRLAPTRVGTASNWVHVDSGAGASYAINSSGQLWSWGYNHRGQLGHGDTTNRSTPTRVGSASNWATVAGGGGYWDATHITSHALAITTSGQLWAWGYNVTGQLGDGTTTDRYSPVRIGSESNWVTVAASLVASYAINNKGELWAWGYNSVGQVGDGTTTDRTAPVRIGSASDWVYVSAGGAAVHAINNKGELYAWGWNAGGQLGLGDTTDRKTPTRVGTASNWVTVANGGDVWGGYDTNMAFAINTSGQLFGWGTQVHPGAAGGIGVGNTNTYTSPTRIGTQSNWRQVFTSYSHAHAINNLGELWGWSGNWQGQIGDGTTTTRLTPVLVSSLRFACNNHVISGWTVIDAPTCTAAGTEQRTCSNCTFVETRSVNALGHVLGPNATCTTSQNCTRCGQQIVSVTGHLPGPWTQTKAPTCTEVGQAIQRCVYCGISLFIGLPANDPSYAALEHDLENWVEGATSCGCKREGCEHIEYRTVEHTVTLMAFNAEGSYTVRIEPGKRVVSNKTEGEFICDTGFRIVISLDIIWPDAKDVVVKANSEVLDEFYGRSEFREGRRLTLVYEIIHVTEDTTITVEFVPIE